MALPCEELAPCSVLLLWIGAGPVCPVVTPVGCNGVCGDPVGCNGVCGLKNQLPIVRTGSAEARV